MYTTGTAQSRLIFQFYNWISCRSLSSKYFWHAWDSQTGIVKFSGNVLAKTVGRKYSNEVFELIFTELNNNCSLQP